MGLFFYLWSRTAASNATADSGVNWQEGQAPSSVNDSGRAMMASTAAFRDDISGAIVTGGSATAYTVTSYQIFDTLPHMSGAMVAFTPHATNTGSTGCTLNVDGLGAKAIRSAPNVELLAGTLILGTPYVATYNNSDAAWYLQNFFGNPYNVPIGAMMDYTLSTTPNSSFVFPIGQAISRTTYATLFASMSTTYGIGDGSTTFNVPDLTGRVVAMKEASATRLTSTYFGGDSTALGAVGGLESAPLSLAQLPTGITSANASQSIQVNLPAGIPITNGSITNSAPNSATGFNVPSGGTWSAATASSATNNSISVTSNNTSGSSHKNVQPTIVLNKILRVI